MLNYQCKVESKSPIRRELHISVEPGSIQEYIEKQFASLQKTAKIKGFRAGKVPVAILRRYYMDDVKADVFSKVIRESYTRALEDNQLRAVGVPEIETASGGELSMDKALTYTARIEIFPEIKLKDYSKIAVTGPAPEPSEKEQEKELDESLDRMLDAHAEIEPNDALEGPAKKGDFVEVSFKGTLEGKEPDKLAGANRLVEIGAGGYLADFEAGLIGMKKGETKSFDVGFPADFSEKSLAGKTALFEATLHEFKRKVKPALDDEFAKRFKLESAAELRRKMADGMKEDRAREARDALHASVVDALVRAHEFEVPAGLIHAQLERLMGENARILKRQGFPEKMIRAYFEKNQEDLAKRAEAQTRATLILDRIAKEQGMKEWEPAKVIEHVLTKAKVSPGAPAKK